MKAQLLGYGVGLLILLGQAPAALAHAAQTDYFVDLFASELQLEFTASFSTGEPMAEATVVVYAPGDHDTPWETTTTDANGHYTFRPDEELVGDWRIEFEQDGHKDIRIIPLDDLGIDYQGISREPTDMTFHALVHWRYAAAALATTTVGAGALLIQRRRWSP